MVARGPAPACVADLDEVFRPGEYVRAAHGSFDSTVLILSVSLCPLVFTVVGGYAMLPPHAAAGWRTWASPKGFALLRPPPGSSGSWDNTRSATRSAATPVR
jgi:hypothetical protein